MNWITWLLILLGLIVFAHLIYRALKASSSKKLTIRLTWRPRPREANPGAAGLWLIVLLLFLVAAFAVQFILSQM